MRSIMKNYIPFNLNALAYIIDILLHSTFIARIKRLYSGTFFFFQQNGLHVNVNSILWSLGIFFSTCIKLKKRMKWTDATLNKNNCSNLYQLKRGHSFIKEHSYSKIRNNLDVINKNKEDTIMYVIIIFMWKKRVNWL